MTHKHVVSSAPQPECWKACSRCCIRRDAKPEQWASQLMADVRAHYWQSDEPLNKQSLSACAEVMRAMAEQVEGPKQNKSCFTGPTESCIVFLAVSRDRDH